MHVLQGRYLTLVPVYSVTTDIEFGQGSSSEGSPAQQQQQQLPANNAPAPAPRFLELEAAQSALPIHHVATMAHEHLHRRVTAILTSRKAQAVLSADHLATLQDHATSLLEAQAQTKVPPHVLCVQ